MKDFFHYLRLLLIVNLKGILYTVKPFILKATRISTYPKQRTSAVKPRAGVRRERVC